MPGGIPLAYRLVTFGVIAPLGRALLRPRLIGLERLPQRGGAVVAFNHDSYLDALLVAQVTRRHLRVMGKAELFTLPLLGRLLLSGGMFPVQRGRGDRAALDTAVELCRAGELVAIFPEGTLNRGPHLGRVRSGAARIALAAGVPIVPVAIGGHHLVRRRQAFVHAGEPLPPHGPASLLTGRLRRALQTLLAGGS
jgi:1-acyl-sn-glycerol-3-phosphate acyltransferase